MYEVQLSDYVYQKEAVSVCCCPSFICLRHTCFIKLSELVISLILLYVINIDGIDIVVFACALERGIYQ